MKTIEKCKKSLNILFSDEYLTAFRKFLKSKKYNDINTLEIEVFWIELKQFLYEKAKLNNEDN